MHKTISSKDNPIFKNLQLLREKSKERKNQALIVIEGRRELSLAMEGGFEIQTLFFNPDLYRSHEARALLERQQDKAELIELAPQLFSKLAYREDTEGVLALARYRNISLDDLKLSANPLILILEGIEKPGNLGAILRTADAAAVDAVLVCDPLADLYNPNCIRSSVGCVFTTQTTLCSSEEALQWCRSKGIECFVTHLESSGYYHEQDYKAPSAIVMGTEATGVSEVWEQEGLKRIKIPMSGKIDSMNVSVATAIMLFEAKRQRGF